MPVSDRAPAPHKGIEASWSGIAVFLLIATAASLVFHAAKSRGWF